MEEIEKYYEGTEPTIGKDGWYLLGGRCWIEFCGVAHLADAEHFKYKLNLINVYEKYNGSLPILEEIHKKNRNLLDKKLYGVLHALRTNEELREISLKTLRFRKKMAERLKERYGEVH